MSAWKMVSDWLCGAGHAVVKLLCRGAEEEVVNLLCRGAEEEINLQPLAKMDQHLVDIIGKGTIRLLDARVLRQNQLSSIMNRQQHEQLEDTEGSRIFLTCEAAKKLLVRSGRDGGRRVGFLTHAWRTYDHPDPDGCTLAALCRALQHPLCKHIQGVFWDFASLYQKPRTSAQNDAFKLALNVMASGYASPLGVTVLRFSDIPRRPDKFEGLVGVFYMAHDITDDEVRSALSIGVGPTDLNFEDEEVVPRGSMPKRRRAIARFVDQRAAAGAVATVRGRLGDKAHVSLWYNELDYHNRGWCVFESAVSTEVDARAVFRPKLLAFLGRLPNKVVEISGKGTPAWIANRSHSLHERLPTTSVLVSEKGSAQRNESVQLQIEASTFTNGKEDKERVTKMYHDFVRMIQQSILLSTKERVPVRYNGERNHAGQMHGKGKQIYADGDIYDGEHCENKRHGKGKLTYHVTYANREEWYDGTYDSDEKHGLGTMRFVDGSKYVGEWKRGQMHGEGKMTYANGDIFEGVYVDGLRWSGILKRQDGSEQEILEWVNLPHGGGSTLRLSNGDLLQTSPRIRGRPQILDDEIYVSPSSDVSL